MALLQNLLAEKELIIHFADHTKHVVQEQLFHLTLEKHYPLFIDM